MDTNFDSDFKYFHYFITYICAKKYTLISIIINTYPWEINTDLYNGHNILPAESDGANSDSCNNRKFS